MSPEPTRRVTVFGASGNIGRRVVEQLRAGGHAVDTLGERGYTDCTIPGELRAA